MKHSYTKAYLGFVHFLHFVEVFNMTSITCTQVRRSSRLRSADTKTFTYVNWLDDEWVITGSGHVFGEVQKTFQIVQKI